jgi:hypothetical protein
MKQIQLLFLPLLLAFGCDHENFVPVNSLKLQSEEYFINDPTGSGSADGFVRLYKKVYHYDQGKLAGIDAYDFNSNTQTYDLGYKFEEYHYSSEGKLSQRIQFIGTSGLKWIKEYEYLNATNTKITRYESNNNDVKNLEDWWVMERTSLSLVVKYYQGSNELYAQLNYDIDEKGNVTGVTGYPALPSGKIYYEYDDSPNPYKFPELSGEYGFDSEKYLSENNVLASTNDSNNISVNNIEYNNAGYPISIITSTSKRILTYQ